jgi:hypothetical protein
MDNDINRAMQRTKRYWHIDGLNEMSLGLLFLLMGLYFFLEVILTPASVLYQILNVGFVILAVGVALSAGRLINALKEHLTYPRTGYVAYRQVKGIKRWVRVLLLFAASAMIGALIVNLPISRNWHPLVLGVTVAGAMLFIGNRVGLSRFYILAATSMLAGAGIALFGFDLAVGGMIYYALMGVALFLSGAITLRNYLKQTQPAQEEDIS